MSEPQVRQESKGVWVFRHGGMVVRGTFDFVLHFVSGTFRFAGLLMQGKISQAFNVALRGKNEEDL